MADRIEISIDALEGDIRSMEEEPEALQAAIKAAYDSVQELDRMWKGPAHDTYSQRFQQDKAAMDTICENIRSIIDFMENAKTGYRNCEAEVSEEIDRIKML